MAYRVIKKFKFNTPEGVTTDYNPGDEVAADHAKHPWIAKHLADGHVEDTGYAAKAAADKAAIDKAAADAEAAKKK